GVGLINVLHIGTTSAPLQLSPSLTQKKHIGEQPTWIKRRRRRRRDTTSGISPYEPKELKLWEVGWGANLGNQLRSNFGIKTNVVTNLANRAPSRQCSEDDVIAEVE